jgi:hypothetical protein
MNRLYLVLALGWAILALMASPAAHADMILNFDDLALPDFGDIPANYGSRVGDTPNIAVSYRTFDPDNDVTIANNLDLWNTGYGDLSKVAFQVLNNKAGEIIFTPDPGYSVTLVSFDMAAIPATGRGEDFLRLVDASGNLLLTIGDDIIIEGGNGHSSFAPDFTFAGTLRLQFGRDWNVGIDNIRISQAVSTVPEPSSLALLALAGPILGLALRSRAPRGRRRGTSKNGGCG